MGRSDIPDEARDNCFEASLVTLGWAFTEHALESDPLIRAIDSSYEDCLAPLE